MKPAFTIQVSKANYLEVYLWPSIKRMNKELFPKDKKPSVAAYTSRGYRGLIGKFDFYDTDPGTVSHEMVHFLMDYSYRIRKGLISEETLAILADKIIIEFYKGYRKYWWRRYLGG